MPRTVNTPSRADYVFEGLRADLLDGRLEPGERLKLPGLAERFEVSMTVIREALTRLEGQGLVYSSPKRGFSVMELSKEDLSDLTFVRVELETLALRASIERGGIDWETAVVGSLHALNRTEQVRADGTFNVDWFSCHRTFHHALISGSGSPRLLAIAAAERDRSELYRAWTRSLAHDDKRDIRAEHARIADLAVGRDVDAAVAALADHIQRTTDVLLEYIAR
ncbi:GntR family transcriptional regulator [Actinomadura rayongensis]|uniref:FCD domain-containing protein n=1 Tax=Actinomadura rayongensis TaxID=1429076 RepID=A0A6I4WER9_9ACTN|nr:GntR family transcriptional regulator [Actinomadura rayongensis]MXQ67543.1 FCD domain-containing protein [Actinomadura rayongensis]